MRVTGGMVHDRETAWPAATRLRIHLPDLPHLAPGQYVLAGEPGRRDPLLLRPLLPSGHDARTRIVEVLVHDGKQVDTAAKHWHASTQLDILGPLGRPFAVEARTRRALLVCTRAGLGPLLFLARTLVADGLEVTLIALFAGPAEAMPSAALPHEVEYVVITDQDQRSDPLVAAAEPLIAWADALYLAVPPNYLAPLLAVLRRRLLRLRKGYAQALLVPSLLPCGVGACDLCVVEARAGARRLCRDGLVFDLLSLI